MSSIEILEAYADLRRELATKAGVLLRPHDLGPKQMTLLSILARHPDISSTELAVQTATDLASVSRALKSLEDDGWITKKNHPHDSRRTVLGLTAAGRRKADEAKKVRQVLAKQLAKQLTSTEQGELVRLLRLAADGLRMSKSEGDKS